MVPSLRLDEAGDGSPSAARLCSGFVDALAVSGASISVFGRDGQQSTICATDSIAARGESLQFELGEGPHWEALRTGLPVLSPDLAAAVDSRWPVFAEAAIKIGMGAVFVFPMTMGAASVGVVDLYCTTARWLDARQIALATSMASRAAAPAVRLAMQAAKEPFGSEHEMAPALRREVHQATGMVQAQLDVSATEALTRLRAYAFTAERSIEDVARDIVTRQLDFSKLAD